MSTTVDHKPLTGAQRTTQAAEEAARLLALDHAKLLGPILAEAALDELRRNAAFADRVRAAYAAEAPAPKPKPAPKRTARTATAQARPPKPKVQLTPIRRVESHEINIAAQLDPYYLFEIYGADQLHLALSEYTAGKLLDEAVPIVQQRHPDTTLPSKASKKAIIEYIVRHVAGR